MVDDGARVLVVVSALSGVTNELQAIANGDNVQARIAAVAARHRAFCGELDLDADAVLGPRLAELQALADDARAATRSAHVRRRRACRPTGPGRSASPHPRP